MVAAFLSGDGGGNDLCFFEGEFCGTGKDSVPGEMMVSRIDKPLFTNIGRTNFKLRFDQADDGKLWLKYGDEGGEDLGNGDEGYVNGSEAWSGGKVLWFKIACIGVFSAYYPGISAKFPV